MKKLVLGLLVVLAIVIVPQVLASKNNDLAPQQETVILSKNNLLLLNGEINGESTAAVIAAAKDLCNVDSGKLSTKIGLGKKLRLKMFMNTPGGSIQSGLEMKEALLGLGCPVDTVTLFAASMGFQLVQGLADRLVLQNGVMMSHHAAGEMQGSFGGVHPSQMDSRYQLWLDRMRELDEQTVARTNGKQTYESYTKEYDHEMWLTGSRSVAEGYSDRIVLVKCDSTLSGFSTKHLNIMGFDVVYDLDNCPINTSPMNIRIAAPDGKSLTSEIENAVRVKFLSQFENKQRQVLPMIF